MLSPPYKNINNTLTKHPKGLYFLFFTEMWERFSFFGMRALLIYYMTKHLVFDQAYASHIYGLYTGFVYFTPFFGGLVADRFLGQHKTVITGAILMAIGHFLMAIESLFFPALTFLIIGNGAFIPNISTQIGALYKPGDHRRDRAFSIFYMGINIGATIAPLICGTLGEIYGWHYGFGAAGIGMLIGLTIYITGRKHLPPDSRTMHSTNPIANKTNQNIRNKFIVIFILMIFALIFRAVYGQQGNTLALWVDAYTNRNVFGWEMPASWFQSFNPFFIIFFTPFITSLWRWQAKRNCESSSIIKMAMGCIITSVAFLIMIPSAHGAVLNGQANILWPIACIFILTIGELYINPIALSLVTKIAPPKMVSMTMGIWYLAYFAGNYMAGFLGTFWEKLPKDIFFLMLSLIVLGAGIAMLSVAKPLKLAIDDN
jgi:proton-dependent oligopeptide transporter, POT family